ncbi:GMC family oxidoreductase [Streptomyces sp. DSM 44917]|uniref:GMC family oxidoreductase n=1 Tax=Streptomyces boetiae TaxID=3075541 RepID=A0ABU2LBD5_9ACTN|nr:GMC family oxidoreductase [Streptomyces sp. DSM 44917]MDT0308864.1 GMC family oxidoreductase [Streptomyces sp. DSM 44917]
MSALESARSADDAEDTAARLASVTWDAVVVGTGMGGGTLGHELARLGRRVLFLEKGITDVDPASGAITGSYAEQTFDLARLTDEEHADRLARAGRSSAWYEDSTPGRKPKRFQPISGSGLGGSSALYGMVTERLFREDFTPRGNFADVGDSTVPEAWPVKYEEMVPWYQRAERLYRVRGTADPLRPEDDTDTLLPPGPVTARNAALAEFLSGRGLHPYGLHVACEYRPECATCETFLCARACKNHAGNVCVTPAVQELGATVLDRTTAVRVEATRTRVTGVVARRDGQTHTFRGRVIVVAGGALQTPVLLLNSRSEDWPGGLANDNDLVGRNLMRHFMDVYLFRTPVKKSVPGQTKEVSVNDFYLADGDKYGTLQSMGHIPPYEFLMNYSREGRRLLGPLHGLARRPWRTMMQDRFIVLAAIMEDLPRAENRVLPADGSGPRGPLLQLQYKVSDQDRARHRRFHRRVRSALGRYTGSLLPPVHVSGIDMNTALGHQCGTCRFGDDPRTSVLDPDNRAWGLDNLYVVDASMMPSSGGINPSLTIAANALRVGHAIHDAL